MPSVWNPTKSRTAVAENRSGVTWARGWWKCSISGLWSWWHNCMPLSSSQESWKGGGESVLSRKLGCLYSLKELDWNQPRNTQSFPGISSCGDTSQGISESSPKTTTHGCMSVCVGVCLCAYLCVFVCVSRSVSIWMCVPVSFCAPVYICMPVWVHICSLWACVREYVYVCVLACICVFV